MIQINPLKSYIDGGVRAALTTPPSASLVFDLPGKAIWVKGVKLKGTDHTYTFNHDNYITLTNTPDKNNPESEDIKIGVNITTLKNAIDTTYNGGTLALLLEGLNTEERTWLAKILHNYINDVLPVTKNLKINGTNYAIYTTENSLPLFFVPVSLGTTGQILACTSSGLIWVDLIQNTDYRVSLSSATSNSDYRIILKQGADNNPETDFVRFSEYLTFNPYTKTLKINNIKVITATDIYTGSTAGLVPAATSAQLKYYLRGDGAWVNIATEMAAANTWRPIKVGNTDALGSGTNTGTLSFIAGTGIALSWDATNKRIIITNSSPDVNHNTDENVRQVPKTDNVNRPLMMINGSTSAGEQINTSMFSTSIYANASTKMITANGFIKAGSSDNCILLAGGGHYSLDNVLHGNSYGTMEGVISDCNSVSVTGIYSSSGFTNRPSGVVNWGTLFNLRLYNSNNLYHRQLFFDCYASDKIWTRSDNGGSWTSWKELITSANISSQSVNYANSSGNADTVDSYHASSLVKFYLSPMTSGAPADSAKDWFINTMPSASGAIVYNVPGSEKTIIAGKSSGSHGHILQLNYDDNYIRLLRYYAGSWKTTDWEKISAGYADSAGNADTLDGNHASAFATANHTHYIGNKPASDLSSTYPQGISVGGIYVNGYPFQFGSTITAYGSGGYFQIAGQWTSDVSSTSNYDFPTEMYIRGRRDSFDVWTTWSRVLTNRNYNNYAPTLTGTGASGTWNINISGNATTANTAIVWKRTWERNNDCLINIPSSETRVYMADSLTKNKPCSGAGFIIGHGWDWGYGGAMIYQDFDGNDGGRLYTNSRQCDGAWQGWNKIAFVKEIPIVTDYYWANIKVSASSSTSTSPTFGSLWINNSYFFKLSGTTFTCQGGTTFTLPSSSLNTNTALLWTTASDGTRDTGIFYNSSDFAFIANSNDHGAVFAVYDTDVTQDFEAGAREISVPGNGGALWARGGFSKNGSSDSYVLLGGGGHKAISDFSMSHSHPYLPLSGGTMTGQISWTPRNLSAGDYSLGLLRFDRGWQDYSDSRRYFPWIGGLDLVSGYGYGNTISIGAYHSKADDCGLYIGMSWDGNNSSTYMTFSRYGDITASNFYSSSDIRLKNNINNISKSIRSFNWKESGLKSYGLIAQEIENEYPELVSSNDNGYKSINYTSALCMLVAKLENGLDELKEKVKLLEDELLKYKNTL